MRPYKIVERRFSREPAHQYETSRDLSDEVDINEAIFKAHKIFQENKPKDFKTIVTSANLKIAEKYDEETKNLEQYIILIEDNALIEEIIQIRRQKIRWRNANEREIAIATLAEDIFIISA